MNRFFAIGLSSVLAVSAGWSAETPADPLAAGAEVVLGIPLEASAARAACAAMLATGRESGRWTAEEARVAEDWLSYVFNHEEAAEPAPKWLPPRADIGWRKLVPLAARPTDPTAATEPVFSWLKTRVAALEAARNGLLENLYRVAIERSESAWLSAKTAADLEPAVRGLLEVKAAVGFKWERLDATRRSLAFRTPPGARAFPDAAWDFYDCWSFIASPEPLLLPDPAVDPAAFTRARRTWLALTKDSQRFLKRPAIAGRFAELDDRFRVAFADLEQELDHAILRDAPAAEFEKTFKRLQGQLIAVAPPAAVSRVAPFPPPPNPTSDTPPDYRRRPPARPPGLLQEKPPPDDELRVNNDYADWLEWRQAREAGDRQRVETARAALLAKAPAFHPRVAAHLAARLAPPPRALTPTPASAGEAIVPKSAGVAELVAALRSRVAENPDAERDAQDSKLIQTWLKFDKGDVGTIPEDTPFAPRWRRIAAGPDGRALLELRDHAARGTIARLVPELAGAVGLPLLPLLRQALEISVAREQREIVRQLLDLERITGEFPDAERAAWNETIAWWNRAVHASPGRPAWMQVLLTTSSPAAAALALAKIKADAGGGSKQ